MTTKTTPAINNEGYFLGTISGWAVGCYCEQENKEAVAYLKQRGFVRERFHKTPTGDKWLAYALTDAGFSRLTEIGRSYEIDRAEEHRKFYSKMGSWDAPQPGEMVNGL